jgi:hypothetical protein
MEREVNVSELEDSFQQRPIVSTKDIRRRSNLIPLNEVDDVNFEINLLNGDSGEKRIDVSHARKLFLFKF